MRVSGDQDMADHTGVVRDSPLVADILVQDILVQDTIHVDRGILLAQGQDILEQDMSTLPILLQEQDTIQESVLVIMDLLQKI